MNFPKRQALALLAALPLMLAGCGGSDAGNDAEVRMLNASAGYASVDLYVDDELTLSGIGFGEVSNFTAVPSGDVTTVLTSEGSGTELLSQSRSLTASDQYSIITFGWEGAIRSVLLAEDQDAPDSGSTALNVLSTVADVGDLDVYLTGTDELLASATPVVSGATAAVMTGFDTVSSGTYRLRVTAADDPDDVRLDVASVTLDSRSVVTLVLSPGRGGVLVDGLLLEQGGGVTPLLNTQARVRVVAAVADSGTVSLTAGSTSLASSAKSPTIRDYVLVDAGDLSVSTTVNGSTLTPQTLSLTAGADLTLLVTGDADTASTVLIEDDNRLPTTTTKYKLRLVHAAPSLASDGLTLTVDYSAVASDLGFAGASDFSSLASNSAASLEVTAPSVSGAVYSATDLNLVAKGVYTLFVFDTTSGPNGVLRKDR